MKYEPRKEYKDYEKLAEWLLIKFNNRCFTDELLANFPIFKPNKEAIRVLAEAFAEEYNQGYSEGMLASSKLIDRG